VFWLLFCPVLFLSAVSFAPILVFTRHYEHVQASYPLSTCTTLSDVIDPDTGLTSVTASYEDSNQIEQTGTFDYMMYYDYRMDKFVKNFFNNNPVYPCYYKDGSILPVDYVTYLIQKSKKYSYEVTAGLVGSWLFIATLSILMYYRVCYSRQPVTRVTKETFEKTGVDKLDVLDWGSVDSDFKQYLYSILYASFDVENLDPSVKTTARVTATMITHHQLRSAAGIIFLFLAAIFIAGSLTMGIEAFFQPLLYNVEVCWCLTSILTFIPASCLVFFFECGNSTVSVTVEVCKHQSGGTITQNITIVGCSVIIPRMRGSIMSGAITYI